MAIGTTKPLNGAGGDAPVPADPQPSAIRTALSAHADTDARCIAAVLAGDTHRFAELIERYQKAVIMAVRGYIVDVHLAEDVAQDVFISAFTNLSSLRQPEAFYQWLMQIARHRAVQSGMRVTKRPDQQALAGIEEQVPQEQDTQRERIAQVLKSVEQLPEPYRSTVLLKYDRDLSCKEIAQLEGVAVSTITSRLTRALVMLRGALLDEKS